MTLPGILKSMAAGYRIWHTSIGLDIKDCRTSMFPQNREFKYQPRHIFNLRKYSGRKYVTQGTIQKWKNLTLKINHLGVVS